MAISLKKSSTKILSSALALSSILTSFHCMPVVANETAPSATISGNTDGHQISTIKPSSSTCLGEQQLSGTDKDVFSKIVPEKDGDITCVKSDGFETKITGESQVQNYHWTAWYKQNLDDDVDTTLDFGNYRGFNQSKIDEWLPHADTIKALNDGKFPEKKDYTYPTDTKDGKLDFWGDIAGYYSVLGDPQYSTLHLEAYQQFSYAVKHVTPRSETTPKPKPETNNDNDNNGGGTGHIPGGTTVVDPPKRPPTPPLKPVGNRYQNIPDPIGNKSCPPGTLKVGWNGTMTICKILGNKRTMSVTPEFNNNDFTMSSNALLGEVVDSKVLPEVLVETSEDGDGNIIKKYEQTTIYYETQKVKVAEADVAANSYATELAAIPRVSLVAGAAGEKTLEANNKGFWKKNPTYWVNNGKVTVKNNPELPYHFDNEANTGVGVNNVNLYAAIKQKDKLYTLIHGYPDIRDVKNPETGKNFTKEDAPKNQPETCVEVEDDMVCSKKPTPVINVEIKLDEDNPQKKVEVDKFVHHSKDKETQDDIKESKKNR